MLLSVYLYLITLIVAIHQTVTVRYVSICIFILDYFDAIHQIVTVRYVSICIFILDYFDSRYSSNSHCKICFYLYIYT